MLKINEVTAYKIPTGDRDPNYASDVDHGWI
jgi:hypothetical protein